MPEAPPEPTWSFAALEDYRAPASPTPQSRLVRWGESVRQLVSSMRTSERAADQYDELNTEREASVVPDPDWAEADSALEACLEGRAGSQASRPAGTVVVGPPGAGVPALLTRWAERRGHRTLTPPAAADRWKCAGAAALPEDESGTLVVPALHELYLRHPAGIEALRSLIEEIRRRDAPIVLGCDSWAWAYLCRATQIDACLQPPLALGALGGPALREWIASLCADDESCAHEFRFAETGAPVAWKAGTDESDQEDETAAFFAHLACRSRGIPSVALALWKNTLRRARDSEDGASREQSEPGRTIWVQPPSRWDLPELPVELERLDAIVLHSLLLHAGLHEDVLHELLPFDRSRVTRSLLELRAMGVAVELDGSWSIPAAAYPSTRAFLVREGFLVDAF